jgi:phenylacetate-CoA ligase
MNWRAFAYRLGRRLQGDRRYGILKELRAAERWSPERLWQTQGARLCALLQHAFEHVPYYRPLLLESGVVTGGMTPRVDLGRFADLPLLARGTIRERARDLEDRRPPERRNRRFRRRSGGTTADPVWVIHDRVSYEHSGAVTLWFDEWSGYAVGQPKVVLWEVKPRQFGRRLLDALRAFAKNETILSVEVLSDVVLDRYAERITHRRPVQFLGFAGAVHQFARRIEATGQPVFSPSVVMTSADALSADMRETIERAFRAPLFNRYGAIEAGGIACQCAYRRGLHVSALTHYVEILRPDGSPCEPGEIGEVVITLLTNYSMPLIRYRIGDLAAWSPEGDGCPCGRPFPVLQDIVGRVLDSFVRPDGAWVHGVSIKRFYHREPWIRQFQVIQNRLDHVHVKLIEHEPHLDPFVARREGLERIAAYLRKLMGEPCEITFEFVDRIPRARSGKARVTMRLVDGEPSRVDSRGVTMTREVERGRR